MQETFSHILIELGNHVPADIELIFHFCYGDPNTATWSTHRHGRHGRFTTG